MGNRAGWMGPYRALGERDGIIGRYGFLLILLGLKLRLFTGSGRIWGWNGLFLIPRSCG
jgi:hypothetical protein